MRKKRLIFGLLYNDGFFVQSRNFRLQKVGDVNWLLKNYNFSNIAKAIDELAIVNISRNRTLNDKFYMDVEKISKICFMPKVFGGAINGLEDAKRLFDLGADKIMFNSLLFENSEKVKEIIEYYGSQATVGCIDFSKNEATNDYDFYSHNGSKKINYSLEKVLSLIKELGVGEVFFQSVTLDGTGFGLDLEILNKIQLLNQSLKTPIILGGGAGNFEHIYEALGHSALNSVLTANLLNFMGDSLKSTRHELILRGVNLPEFIQST